MKLSKQELNDWLDHLELMEKFRHFERHGVKLAHLIKQKVGEIVEEMKHDEEEQDEQS